MPAFVKGIALARRLLPQRCALCVAPSDGALLCRACDEALPRPPPACPVCALPSRAGAACGSCAAHPPPYAATVAALTYDYPVDRLLKRLKYRGELALADWAADALAAKLRTWCDRRSERALPDCVVAMPLARSRQRQRGFNQALEIAARVAGSLALPLAPVLTRVAAARPQAALPWNERRHNVRGAFAAHGEVHGARLALVDDVMTTGATLAEAALALGRAGAARVDCWVVARTLPSVADATPRRAVADPVVQG